MGDLDVNVLLDTNILIHREAATVVRDDIGVLFNWLDRLGHAKCVHPASLLEIELHADASVRRSFRAKLASYVQLVTTAPMADPVAALSRQVDRDDRDRRDTQILNEIHAGRAEALITEDRGIGRKAAALGISDRVFTIDGYLEKVTAENPSLVEYGVPSVRRSVFGDIDLSASFFDSLRDDYPGFDGWFTRKSQDPVYVCFGGEDLVAFLYVKVEGEREPYPDIVPPFPPRKRLKIGTLKVQMNGFRLGERFMKIVFDNAVRQRVDEVYVTVYRSHDRLISLLSEFGFVHHGSKGEGEGAAEQVYVRHMAPEVNASDPKATYPFVSQAARHFLVPIYPEYHTDLFPDSILNNEDPLDFVDPQPHRNAVSKVYLSRSYFRALRSGDVIVFYRTGGYYKSVVTTIGIVENVHTSFEGEDDFIQRCRRRSVFDDDGLREHWRHSESRRPFVVEFCHVYSLPKRPNMRALIDAGVIADVDSAPRGFTRITHEQFDTIIGLSETDTRIVVS
jgi:hypothetical protein